MKSLDAIVSAKKKLVFDFDLTIAKLVIDWSRWHTGIAKIYAKFNYKYNNNNVHKVYTQIYNQMAREYGQKFLVQARSFNQQYEAENVKGYLPSKTLVPLIKKLKDKNLYVYSSNSRTTVLQGLKDLGIEDRFEQIISRDEVIFIKPNPYGFTLIPDFEKNKGQFLMFGDSSADKEAAEAVGIDFYQWTEFGTY